MTRKELQERAVEYYACYIWLLFPELGVTNVDALIDLSNREDVFGNKVPRLFNYQAVIDALEFLEENNVIKFLKDDFGPDLLVLTGDAGTRVSNLMNNEASPFYKFRLAGNTKVSWIRTAIDALNEKLIEANKEVAGFNEVAEISHEDEGIPIEEQPWEPLEIDRSNADYQHAIEVSEKAIEVIEQNNGYASSEPSERNGIVKTIRGTLDAVKEGSPSKALIREGLLKPLRYVAKKFADSAMGEFAKLAVLAILKYFFS
ncbi:MAG: hypothetical protein WB764_23305 [Xanthobacteraceae bacterium]